MVEYLERNDLIQIAIDKLLKEKSGSSVFYQGKGLGESGYTTITIIANPIIAYKENESDPHPQYYAIIADPHHPEPLIIEVSNATKLRDGGTWQFHIEELIPDETWTRNDRPTTSYPAVTYYDLFAGFQNKQSPAGSSRMIVERRIGSIDLDRPPAETIYLQDTIIS